ncbi:Zinc finger protein 446 [Vulpes lagopus]
MAAQMGKASALAPGVLQSTPALMVGEPSSETPGQCCWEFCYKEEERPYEALAQLQEPCCQWLQPEACSKEQMLSPSYWSSFWEQFLPPEIQACVWRQQPCSLEEAAALVERLQQ